MVHFDAKLTGTVEDVSLADLLQLFHYARKSVTLHVSGSLGGTVVMMAGEIRHAECAGRAGEDALAMLLAQKLVRIRTCAADSTAPRTVRRSFGAVVLDLLRQNDEYERDTGDLPVKVPAIDPALTDQITRHFTDWLDVHPDVEHGAVIDPRQHYVVACDSPKLWGELVQSLLIQTLVAPYFDDTFDEINDLLSSQTVGADGEDKQTVVTFGGRRYVLALLPDQGWVAALIFNAADVSHGLSLTHMVALRHAVFGWLGDSAQALQTASVR